jgi:hypothetical protein
MRNEGHEPVAKKRTGQPLFPNLLDYSSSMSGCEKECLVAEAILAAKKKRNGQIRPKMGGGRKKQWAIPGDG